MNNDQLTGRQLDILAAFAPGANGDITDNTAGSLLCDMEKAVRNLTMAKYCPESNPISDSTFNVMCCTIEWLQEGLGIPSSAPAFGK